MAFSLGAFPNETIFVDCRAFVFYYANDIKQWTPARDNGVYSRIQLVCQRSSSGTSGMYRIHGRLETSGSVSMRRRWKSEAMCNRVKIESEMLNILK